MITQQAMFDTVVAHLLTQGKKSTVSGPSVVGSTCAYRGAAGLKCAIGAMIPDAEYDESMELKDSYQLLDIFPHLSAFIPYRSLACSLQEAHDKAQTDRDGKFHIPSLKFRLSQIAENYSLTPPAILNEEAVA